LVVNLGANQFRKTILFLSNSMERGREQARWRLCVGDIPKPADSILQIFNFRVISLYLDITLILLRAGGEYMPSDW